MWKNYIAFYPVSKIQCMQMLINFQHLQTITFTTIHNVDPGLETSH